jgi:EAL and modified HD-GYP domain-containing signal transduction protein
LLQDYITLLPSEQTVVEVLESVPPDDLVKTACLRLKEAGYMIALDDFVVNDPRGPLCELADVIKVDLQLTSMEDAAAMVKRYDSRHCHMLAEKVETREQFLTAKQAGFFYFQGYFFRRPEVMQARDIPANGLNCLRMLRAISRDELDTDEIESVVKSEASLCYRLLRYLNSTMFGFANEIHSVRHALMILGEHEVRRGICLVATLGAGRQKSSELVSLALVRARFCELLSPKGPHRDSDLFLMGLMSIMDVVLETSMTQVLEHVPLDHEIKAALLGQTSPLQPVYQLMLAQESGEWANSVELTKRLRFTESEVAQAYWQALLWARQVTAGQLP